MKSITRTDHAKKKTFFPCLLFLICISCSSESDDKILSAENFITSFVVKNTGIEYEATIGTRSISADLPSEFSLEPVKLEVEISLEAKIDPAPSSITSLLNPVVFTVTAENGSKREYTLDIERQLYSENSITSFELRKGDFSFSPNVGSTVIEGTVPSHILLEDIVLEIEISDGATIEPAPESITSIADTFIFVVTAENGETNEYSVDITRELSSENAILGISAKADFNNIVVNKVSEGKFFQRLPSFMQTDNISLDIEISDFATISPNPIDINDYTSPVVYKVIAENGEESSYEVGFEVMDIDFEVRCSESNANKWFGGDDRDNPNFEHGPYDRNVGTGQILQLSEDLNPDKFGVLFDRGFAYYQGGTYYDQDLEVQLDIRDENGIILGKTSVIVPPTYRGGWVYFDLTSTKVYMKANRPYFYTWHLVNGGELGVNTGSIGNNESIAGEECGQTGFSGQSRVAFETNLEEEWGLWYEHPWHFNYSLSGKK